MHYTFTFTENDLAIVTIAVRNHVDALRKEETAEGLKETEALLERFENRL